MSARRAMVEQSADAISATLTTTAVTTARRAMPVASARRALEADEFITAPSARRALSESLAAAETVSARRAAEQGGVPVALTIDEYTPARAFIKAEPRRKRSTSRFVATGLGLAAVIGTVSGGLAITNSAMATGTASPQDTAEAVATDGVGVETDQDQVVEETEQPAADETPAVVEIEPITVQISTTVDPASVTAPGQQAPLSTAEALAKAKSMVGDQNYGNMCLALSAAFYGYSSAGVNSATDAAAAIEAAGQMHTDMTNIPVGALIWYDGGPSGNPYGHVAMYAGDGMIYSNGAPTGVGLIPLDEPADSWHEPIIGWSTVWLPSATN